MSDFDKEAEREKLREKYERDKAEREATQRMSDLLLKGATMTNMHCGTCGDPLFKQDGTTFCPSCHGNPDAVEGTDLEAQPAEGDAETTGADDRSDASASGRGDAGAGTDAEPSAGSRPTDAGSEAADRQPSRSQSGETPTLGSSDRTEPADSNAAERDSRAAGRDEGAAASSTDAATPSRPSRSEPTPDSGREPSRRASGERDRTRAPASRAAGGDVESAHASLVRALEKWAEEAAAADDPRYARECLEAAREASETLNALR